MPVTNVSAGQQPLTRPLYSAQGFWARDGTGTRAAALLFLIGAVERRGARRRPIGGVPRWHVRGADPGAGGPGLVLQGLWRSRTLTGQPPELQNRVEGPLSLLGACHRHVGRSEVSSAALQSGRCTPAASLSRGLGGPTGHSA